MTDKKKRFAERYVLHYEAKRAAVEAGYSEKTAAQIGYDLKKDQGIIECIKELEEERKQRTTVDYAFLSDKFLEITNADYTTCFDRGENGKLTFKSLEAIPEHLRKNIVEIHIVDNAHGQNVKVKFTDKMSAYDKLCRHLKYYGEETQNEKPTINIYTDPETASLIEDSDDD